MLHGRGSRLGAIVVALLLVMCFAGAAHAAGPYNVNNDPATTGDTSDATPGDGICADVSGNCTLRAAIEEANADTGAVTINVPPAVNPNGTYELSSGELLIDDTRNVTINGTTGDPKDVLINADGGSRVLEVNPDATATLNGVTLEGGYIDSCGDPDGGGINVNPGDSGTTSLTLNKSRVTRNVIACDGDGGGIRAGTDTAVALNGSRVDNNSVLGEGGGIYFKGTLSLTDSKVDGNTTTRGSEDTDGDQGGGGGIFNDEGSLNATRSSINNNVDNGVDGNGATSNVGGGVAATGAGDMTFTDSHVDNNFTQGGGGGIGTVDSTGALTVTRTTLNNNEAYKENGGAIYYESCGPKCSKRSAPRVTDSGTPLLTISDSTLNANAAHFAGGAVYYDNDGEPLSITGTTLNSNRARNTDGGAIYTEEDAKVDGSTLNGNFAKGSGGAIYSRSSALSLGSSTLDGNVAQGNCIICNIGSGGGAVWFDSGSDNLTVDRTKITNNLSEEAGGGVYALGGEGDATFTKSNIDNNEARRGRGGGFWTRFFVTIDVTDTTVNGNKASKNDGGGIYNGGSGDLSLLRARVEGNFAKAVLSSEATGGDGGGVYNDGHTTTILDSSISHNVADHDGGGLFDATTARSLDDTPPNTIVNSTIGENHADGTADTTDSGEGGGIFVDNSGGLGLTNDTIAGDIASTGDGGGVFNDNTDGGSDALVFAENTIIAHDTASGGNGDTCGPDPSAYSSLGHNIDSTNDCGFGAAADQVDTDPRLGPLQDNGGHTLTFALADNSTAIDAGRESTCESATPTTDNSDPHDQRQAHRPAGAACDIGAYEAHSLADLAITKTASPNPVVAGGNVTYTITVTNNGPDSLPSGVTVSDTVPAGTTFVSATPSQGTCSGTSTVACDLGGLANGASATVTLVVKTSGAGPISNTATVAGAPTDPDGSNNSATANSSAVAASALGGQGVQSLRSCTTAPPRSSISRNGLFAAGNTIRLVGRTIDLNCAGSGNAITRVQIAIGQFASGAAASRCRFLTRSGSLGAVRSCKKPVFRKARRGRQRNGKVPWTFRIRNLHLPAGQYFAIVQSTDSGGRVEKSRRRYNFKRFTIH